MTITEQALAAMQPPPGAPSSAWALRIGACWQASVKAILEVGRLLEEAKAALPHGEFGTMIKSDLPFGRRTAEMLMAIAVDPRITNAKHVSLLPPSWGTLYELTKWSDEQFERGVADKVIRPDMERSEALDETRTRNTASRRALAQELSDASALQPCGRKFPVVYADPAWKRKAGIGNRAYENSFPTMDWDDILAMPVAMRLLPDAWLFLWIPRPHLLALHSVSIETAAGWETFPIPLAWATARAWGFDNYSTCFIWTKTDDEHPDDHGSGLIVWDQDEILCLFKRGRGLPMPSGAEKVGSNHRERPGKHSAKPTHYRDMINRMTGGVPVLELFAREDDEHVLPPNFFTWGNQSKNTAEAPVIDGERFDEKTGEILENHRDSVTSGHRGVVA